MLDTMFQHPGRVQCALHICHVLRTLYLFKESTSYFLLAKLRAYYTESDGLLVPKVVSTIDKCAKVIYFMCYFRHFSDLFCKIIYGKAPILCKYVIYALCALLYPFCAGKYKQGPRNQPKLKDNLA